MKNKTLETLREAVVDIDQGGGDGYFKVLMTISATLLGVVSELGLIRQIMEKDYEKRHRSDGVDT